jgi:hypothetical protein
VRIFRLIPCLSDSCANQPLQHRHDRHCSFYGKRLPSTATRMLQDQQTRHSAIIDPPPASSNQ